MELGKKPSWMRRHKDKLDQISLDTESMGTRNQFTVRTKSKDSGMSIHSSSSEMGASAVDNQTLLNFDVEMPSELSVNGAASTYKSPLDLAEVKNS